jgi:tRNA threonylcarbamoyladenosine biosynthesis protein TsaE
VKSLEIDITNENSLPEASKKILEFAKTISVFTFDAPMGAGKTTFIKELCKTLGSQSSFSSPTFSIVNEYSSPIKKIYHFDLYRLRKVEELYDIGFEEYLDGGNYCFIDWPQLALDLLSKPYLSIIIKVHQNNRYLSAEIIG